MWFLKLVLLVLVPRNGANKDVTSPCPDVFQYNVNGGNMTFKNDFSGSYRVQLNMSIAAFVNENIGIERVTSPIAVQNGADIVYRVTFPRADRLPVVHSVIFNGKVRCMDDSDMSEEITSLSAYDYFSVSIMKRRKPQMVSFLDFMLPYTSVKVPDSTSTTTTTAPFFYHTMMPITTTTARTTPQPAVIFENRHLVRFECGVGEDTQALIVHGKPTSEGQYPWLVAMFHLQDDGEYKFKCAGNLISNKHVVSAAHCVRRDRFENVPLDTVILVLGKHNIKSWAVRSEIRDIKTIYVHPDYVRPSDADISILVMYKSVEFTEKIKPVCLWVEETTEIVGSEGMVVGWGRDEHFNEYVNEPRELSMPVVSQEDCLRSDERFLKLTSNRTFCAGAREGKGACTGDSGGGFLMKRSGRWTLRGIVSSALVDSKTHSCDLHNYVVFTDVIKYKSWFDRVLTSN